MKSFFAAAMAVAIASASNAAPNVHSFTYDGSTVHGVNELPGVDLIGTYSFEGGEPRVELRPDGTGCWANHSRPCVGVRWWIQSDAAGKPLGQYGEGGSLHTILFEHVEDPSYGRVGPYNGFELAVDKVGRRIIIAGEREKAF